MSNLSRFDQGLVPWLDCGLATSMRGYAGMLLFATWIVFRRKALNL